MSATAQLVSNAHLLMSDSTRRTEVTTAIAAWGVGAALAIAAACHVHDVAVARARAQAAATDQAPSVDWSIKATGGAIEVNGALVMPEDRIVNHPPPPPAAAEMQKP
jgi:hypothetical protein